MSLPPELRVLCIQLSSTPAIDLPRLTPVLLRHVFRCHIPLSCQTGSGAKNDGSASSVLVHKLKTQLTALLNGKSPEGRFTAVVLIKAVVEVGGWEVLRGTDVWVRGLLSILGKPDSSATKELCVLTLTKIYSMTHQYQTLVREITTPTLPGFITSCLNLISSRTSRNALDVSSSLVETILDSFAALLPRHTTLYRPFVSQIRSAIKQYIAPTSSDGIYVTRSLKQSARKLIVLLHQTVAKGGGGEEWGKAFRELIKNAQSTADNVLRGVIEDWESTAGYVPESVDLNEESSGGGRTAEDLPRWEGISAGIDRLVGLLELLATYFDVETSTPVAIPLGAVVDLIMRLLSVANTTPLDMPSTKGGPRLNPAIDREEKDILFNAVPQIYVAAVGLLDSMADRLGEALLPLSQGLLTQITWVFTYGRHDENFRRVAYVVASKLLQHTGQSLGKSQTSKLFPLIRSCCKDMSGLHETDSAISVQAVERNGTNAGGSNQNADSFLRKASETFETHTLSDSSLFEAAELLLPSLLSRLPQHHLDMAMRALIERTVILNHSKAGMIASVLNPFVGKNGAALPSIVPHLSRAFGSDPIVEILLRPRMPLLPTSRSTIIHDTAISDEAKDEDMDLNTDHDPASFQETTSAFGTFFNPPAQSGQDFASSIPPPTKTLTGQNVQTHNESNSRANVEHPDSAFTKPSFLSAVFTRATNQTSPPTHDTPMEEADSDSSGDESVHLTMQLDSDSDED